MRSSRMLLTLLLSMSIGVGGAAHAATHKIDDRGVLGIGSSGEFANGFGSAGSFRDVLTFSLTDRVRINGVVAALGVSADFALQWGATTIANGALINGQYSFDELAPGSYSLSIFGTNNAFGNYTATYSVAAVPEAETWLMIIIGLGLVAFQLQRKQKALRQQSLSPA